MAGNLTFEALKKAVDAGEIDTVVVAQTDMQGRLMGKRFHAANFVEHGWRETHSCNYVLATDMEMHTVEGYTATSWAQGYGDYTMKPDLATLRRTPWLEGTALVLCDVFEHDGETEVAHAPRTMLRRQLARLETLGFAALAASELECFLFREGYEALRDAGHRGMTLSSAYNEDYHVFQTTKEEDVMRALRNGLHGAGIPVECTKGEADAGQEEINIRYSGALDTADNHAIAKTAAKEIAWAAGRSLTFMAKWNAAAAGSSSHIHISLRDRDDRAVFFEPGAAHGMSSTMRHFLAGLLAHARELTVFLAPCVNSYKRFAAGTFAPTHAVWSPDNRTAGFRICGVDSAAVRIECRIGGADLNPYLVLAALLAAGIAGIEQELELEEAHAGDAYRARKSRRIPETLREATFLLDRSTMLRAAFGDTVVDHYVHAARWEQAEFDRAVTDYEVNRGFERA